MKSPLAPCCFFRRCIVIALLINDKCYKNVTMSRISTALLLRYSCYWYAAATQEELIVVGRRPPPLPPLILLLLDTSCTSSAAINSIGNDCYYERSHEQDTSFFTAAALVLECLQHVRRI